MQITLHKAAQSVSLKWHKFYFTQLKPAHSPNRNQSVNSRAELTVRFLRKGITNNKWIKYKSNDDNTLQYQKQSILKLGY